MSPCLLRGTAPVRLIVIGKIMNKDFRSMTLDCATNSCTILRLYALNNFDRLKTCFDDRSPPLSAQTRKKNKSRINIHVKTSFASRSLRDIVSPAGVLPGIANEETFYLRKYLQRFRSALMSRQIFVRLISSGFISKKTWFVCLCGFSTWGIPIYGVWKVNTIAHTCCNEKYKQTLEKIVNKIFCNPRHFVTGEAGKKCFLLTFQKKC